MLKKWLIACFLLFLIGWHSDAEAAVRWDGAEIVKGQTGKITFSKDVKVYKKNANGQFDSLVVKKGQYFRVYNIEKYNNQTYYWMSSGYRVQATNLTQFKAIPLETRAQFYNNAAYFWNNQNMVVQTFLSSGEKYVYSYYSYLNNTGFTFNDAGQFEQIIRDGNKDIKTTLDPTDVYITEQIPVAEEIIEVKQNTPVYWQPYKLGTTRPVNFNLGYNYTKQFPQHTLLQSAGVKIGDYYAVYLYKYSRIEKYLQILFVKASDVEMKSSPTAKGTWYVQDVAVGELTHSGIKSIFDKGTAVTYYGISEDNAVIGYEGEEWFIPYDQVAPQ